MRYVGAAAGPVHVRQGLVGPPAVEGERALLGFVLADVSWGNVGQINGQDVCDQDFRGTAATGSVGAVLCCEILAEGALRLRAIFWSAARADFAPTVSDDPHCAFAERALGVSLFGAQPETSSFCGTRHSALIFSIAASVV
jgi:hypothetical protein